MRQNHFFMSIFLIFFSLFIEDFVNLNLSQAKTSILESSSSSTSESLQLYASQAEPTKISKGTDIISQDKDDIVNLSMTWWGSKRRHELTIKVIELFQKKYPTIKISYEFTGWADYWTKMEGLASSGKLPDIMQQDYAMLKKWVKKDWIAPLNEFENRGALNLKHVSDAILETGRTDEKLYGVSLGTNSQTFVFDVDAFQKAGIALPEDDWSWDEFEKIAIAIKENLGIWGIGDRLISPALLWESYFLGHGQWTYNDEGNGLAYSDGHLIDYLNMILRLQKAGAIPNRTMSPNLRKDPETDVEMRPILKNKAAMDYMQSNLVIAFRAAAGEGRHFKMLPLPRPKGGKPSNWIKQSMFFSITSQSKHPKEAVLFIDFFTNSLEANEIMLGERGVPVSSVIRQNLQLLLSPAQFDMFVYQALIEYNNSPTPPPYPAAHNDIVGEKYYTEFINPVLFREITPEIGAKRIRERAARLLIQRTQK